MLHITAGHDVLELGAGGGSWTQHLERALREDLRLTAAVFNPDLAERASRGLARADVRLVGSQDDLPRGSFDFVLGTAILSHDEWERNLEWARDLLRPG